MKVILDLIEKMTDVRLEVPVPFKVADVSNNQLKVLAMVRGELKMVTIANVHTSNSLTSACVDIVLEDDSLLTVDFGELKLNKAIANVDHTALPSVLLQQLMEVFYLTDMFPNSAPNRVSLDRMYNDLFGQVLSEDFWEDPEVLETLQCNLIGYWVNDLSPNAMYLTNTIQAVLDLPKPNRHSFVSMFSICNSHDDTVRIITYVNDVKSVLKIKQHKLDIYSNFDTKWFTDQLPEEGIDILSDLGYMFHIESTKNKGK